MSMMTDHKRYQTNLYLVCHAKQPSLDGRPSLSLQSIERQMLFVVLSRLDGSNPLRAQLNHTLSSCSPFPSGLSRSSIGGTSPHSNSHLSPRWS